MRISILETETEIFESQSLLFRPRPRLWDISLETKTETLKLLKVKTETKIWPIFERLGKVYKKVEFSTKKGVGLISRYPTKQNIDSKH